LLLAFTATGDAEQPRPRCLKLHYYIWTVVIPDLRGPLPRPLPMLRAV